MEVIMFSKIRGKEILFAGIEIRLPREDGLTDAERLPIDKLARRLGYESVADLAERQGFSSPRELAYSQSFKNTRDFFLGNGWSYRLAPYNLNGKSEIREKDLKAIDPNYDEAVVKQNQARGKIAKTDEKA
jgi:hypothetical protein